MKKPQAGFTIVELLVIIVVIGILASITITSYRGTQDSANDTTIKNAVSQTADALQLWSSRNNKLPTETVTANGGRGYIQKTNYTAPTIEDKLITDGYLPAGFADKLKSNTVANNKILWLDICTNGRYAVYAALSDSSGKSEQQTRASAAGCPTTPFTSNGMNYILVF